MSVNDDTRDGVTAGEIRLHLVRRLDSEIDTLNKLIRQGYHKRYDSEKYLKEAIGHTLTQLDNLKSWAGLPELYRVSKE